MKVFTFVLISFALGSAAWAQPAPESRDRTIEPAMRKEVIDGGLDRLNRLYVFPEVAKKMEEAVRERQAKGEYDSIKSGVALARKLTEDLQAVSRDKHLRVNFSYDPLPERRNQPPSQEEIERQRRNMAFNNYGFEKVERLPGNIGYVDYRAFIPPEFAGDTVAAAMNFVANSDALIIDIRANGGGSPAAVAMLTSYLYGPNPVHLNNIYWRPNDETRQWWTLPYVPGKRFEGKDVYVLTSRRTFSAAEEFAYNLKNLKRVTIVGETTGGGAHPGGVDRINEHFMVWVPRGRSINPISKTNWEGTGVHPDVEVPAPRALKTAHLMALKKITEKTTEPELKKRFEGIISDLEKEIEEMKSKASSN